MIRPITCVCFLLACGSGLYLYQAKHRVNVLDREIEKTVRATDATREQIRLLHAEWTVLNQPDRLQALAGQFLTLQPTKPGQFTSMADLDARLPPVPPPAPPAVEPPAAAVAATAPAPATPSALPAEATVAQASPATEKPANTAPAPTRPKPETHPAVRAPASVVAVAAPRPAAPEARPHPAMIRAATHPMPVTRPVMPMEARYAPVPVRSPPPITGSMLGMAHSQSMSLPAPAPMPGSIGLYGAGN